MTPEVANSTDVTRYVVLRNSSTGEPYAGYTITNLDLQYTRARTAPAAKVDATALAATNSAHADNKAIEIDATSSPGLYRVDWPDAAFASGVNKVLLCVSGPGIEPCFEEVPLLVFDVFAAAPLAPLVIRSNTTQGGGSLTTAVLDSGASATDDAYKDALFIITTGTHAGKMRQILSYTGSSKTATFYPDDQLSAAPNTVGYALLPAWLARLQPGHEPPAIPISGTQGDGMRNMADLIQVGGYLWADMQKVKGDATAAANLLAALLSELTGTASGGGHSTTVMNTDIGATVANKFAGRRVYWTSGVLNRESATIISNTAGGQLTYAATTAAPSNGDTFVIV